MSNQKTGYIISDGRDLNEVFVPMPHNTINIIEGRTNYLLNNGTDLSLNFAPLKIGKTILTGYINYNNIDIGFIFQQTSELPFTISNIVNVDYSNFNIRTLPNGRTVNVLELLCFNKSISCSCTITVVVTATTGGGLQFIAIGGGGAGSIGITGGSGGGGGGSGGYNSVSNITGTWNANITIGRGGIASDSTKLNGESTTIQYTTNVASYTITATGGSCGSGSSGGAAGTNNLLTQTSGSGGTESGTDALQQSNNPYVLNSLVGSNALRGCGGGGSANYFGQGGGSSRSIATINNNGLGGSSTHPQNNPEGLGYGSGGGGGTSNSIGGSGGTGYVMIVW